MPVSKTAAAALKHIIKMRKQNMEWRTILSTYFPGGGVRQTRLQQLVKSGTLAGVHNDTTRAFENAYAIIRQETCGDCNFYEVIGARFLNARAVSARSIIADEYLGAYWSFNRAIQRRNYYSEEENAHLIVRHDVQIVPCDRCARPVFRVEQKQSGRWRQGALFLTQDRIHILIIDNKYMPHAVVRPVADLSEKPLSGIALFDEEDRMPNITARRIAFVKKDGRLGRDPRLFEKMDKMLVNETSDINGALSGWSIE